MKEIKRNAELLYILHENDSKNLLLTVTCGGVGMYNVRIELTEEERESFLSDGEEFLDALTKKIQKKHKRF